MIKTPRVLGSGHPCTEGDGSKVTYSIYRTSNPVSKHHPPVMSVGGDPVTNDLGAPTSTGNSGTLSFRWYTLWSTPLDVRVLLNTLDE